MTQVVYDDLDLLFSRAGTGFRVQVIAAPAGGEADATFDWPPPGIALPGLEFLDPDAAKAMGRALFEALFQGNTLACLRRSLDAVRRKDKGLRIRLRLADTPQLAALPWEILWDPERDGFLAHSDETPLVRYLHIPQTAQPLSVQPPLKVLAVISGPSDYDRLDTEREWRTLNDALEGWQRQGRVQISRLEPPTVEALQRRPDRDQFHVLHFSGHGAFDSRTRDGVLILEDEHGRGHPVHRQKLGTLLAEYDSLRLVFLEACHGARTSHSDRFTGTAQGLVRQGIPAVIAMQVAITEKTAMAIVGQFYRALAEGCALDAGLARARSAVYTAGRTVEWATPVLFSRLRDNRLLVLDREPRDIENIQWFEPETVDIPAGSFLMGSREGSGVPGYETPYAVNLDAYRIGVYPVTNEQYAEFIRQTGHPVRREAGWRGHSPPPGKLDHPVSGVTWYDALAYCEWLSVRTGRSYSLPSEAQWEKAARGEDGRLYPWGDEWDPARSNYGGDGTTPVDAHPNGASAYGCYDMVGNVRQWTSTLWGRRMMAPDPQFRYPWKDDGRRDDLGASRNIWRVFRGAGYAEDVSRMRCSARGAYAPRKPGPRGQGHGFRVLLQPEGE